MPAQMSQLQLMPGRRVTSLRAAALLCQVTLLLSVALVLFGGRRSMSFTHDFVTQLLQLQLNAACCP